MGADVRLEDGVAGGVDGFGGFVEWWCGELYHGSGFRG